MAEPRVMQADPTRLDASGEPDLRVRRRDRTSIELKFRHLLEPGRPRYPRRRTTRMRVVFFLPYSFNIRPDTMNPGEFYDDVKLYVRFNTPALGIDELVTEGSPDSPLDRLVRAIDGRAEMPLASLRYEAKLLGAITKSVLRDELVGRLHGTVGQERIDSFLEVIQRLRAGFSRFRRAFGHAGLPGDVRETVRLVDEHLSLTMENYLVRMATDERVREASLSVERLLDAVAEEQAYRRERGYRSVVRADDPRAKREEYIHRSKMLKHFSASALFLEIHRGDQSRRVEHLLYGIAAGAAMAIATAISFLGQVRFGTLSSTLFLVLVVAYVIKDRIKDAFRSVFQRTLGRLFYDTRTRFKDRSTHRAMGVVKERTVFLGRRRVDPALAAARRRGGFEEAIMEETPERVLEYTKLLRVNERRLHQTHRRITGLADINIIDLKRLLRYLVRQRESVPVLDGDRVALEETRRIYHLNMLVAADAGEGERWTKVRLIVDAGGISRIEYPSDEAGAPADAPTPPRTQAQAEER